MHRQLKKREADISKARRKTLNIACEILQSLNGKGYNNGYIYHALEEAKDMIGLCEFQCPANLKDLAIPKPAKPSGPETR